MNRNRFTVTTDDMCGLTVIWKIPPDPARRHVREAVSRGCNFDSTPEPDGSRLSIRLLSCRLDTVQVDTSSIRKLSS